VQSRSENDKFDLIVEECLTIDPNERPDIEKILSDPFVVDFLSKITSEFILRMRREFKQLLNIPLTPPVP